MKQVRVVIEYITEKGPVMRWERQSLAGRVGAFELLGRAFEVAQREQGEGLDEALKAFFRGAMMTRDDVAEALPSME